MPYRPQYAYEHPPPGWADEEFEYYFDNLNTPALDIIPSSKVPLQLQPDAEFRIRGIQISGNVGNLAIRFWTPSGEQISQCLIEADRAYAGTLNDGPPVGRLPVPLADEIVCPAGAVLLVDIADL